MNVQTITPSQIPAPMSREATTKLTDNNSSVLQLASSTGTIEVPVSNPSQQASSQSGTRVLPLLYIQGPPPAIRGGSANTSSGNAVCGSQKSSAIKPSLSTSNQQFIPTLAPKLTFGSSPTNITTTNSGVGKMATLSSGQSSQHFVIQTPRSCASTPAASPTTMVPVSVAGSGITKPAFAYLGTLIKQSVGKSDATPLMLPAGQLVPNANQKLLLTNVSLPLPQLAPAPAPSINSSTSPQQSQKVTSLLVPMNIPAQVTPAKNNMLNLKISNGPIHAENKGSVTVIRDTKSLPSQLPPLQPISKHSTLKTLTPIKPNGILLPDSTTLTSVKEIIPGTSVLTAPHIISHSKKLNLDEDTSDSTRKSNSSGVIILNHTPSSQNCSNPKVNSLCNNIFDDKKKINQDLNKCLQEAVDAIFAPPSPRLTKENEKIIERGLGDDVTVIKVIPSKHGDISSEEPKKEFPEDDVKIEIVKPLTKVEGNIDNKLELKEKMSIKINAETEKKLEQKQETKTEIKIESVKKSLEAVDVNSDDFDPMKVLEWKDGVGVLPGSDLKFRVNEFGLMEMIDDEDNEKNLESKFKFGSVAVEIKESCELVTNVDAKSEVNGKLEIKEVKIEKTEPTSTKLVKEEPTKPAACTDEIYCCQGCGCYGLSSEFINEQFCSEACVIKYCSIKAAQTKKERELLLLRLRRRKKRLLYLTQLQQQEELREALAEQRRKQLQKAKQEAQEREERKRQQRQKHLEQIKQKHLEKKKLTEHRQIERKRQLERQQEMKQKQIDEQKKLDKPIQKEESEEEKQEIVEEEELKQVPEHEMHEETDNIENAALNCSHSSISEEETTSCDGVKHPWKVGKKGFSWAKYLDHCKAKAAPVKLFKDPFPYSKNGFKVGMKMEGIDPEHPSYYCVLTVVDIQGYRIRLHFDGYPENYDFWVNADSVDIFPAGWCEKNNHRLMPPKGYGSNFNWATYLKQSRAQAAPRNLFANKTGNTICPNGFRLGMKLEAVDRKNSSLVCVASVADLMDNRILVHFDSWDDIYDYWADPTSPYIHPIGWCEENGYSLTPPNNYKGKPFSWEQYLKDTKSVAAPARAFKQRAPTGFREGMKLECVDPRVPSLIRVATIDDVHEHQIKIRFDGWSSAYSFWLDDDSTDIHPIGWCSKTGHPLEPPVVSIDTSENVLGCPTPGCRGIGHIEGHKYHKHDSIENCPYSEQNLNKDDILPDRLFTRTDLLCKEVVIEDDDDLEVIKDEEKQKRPTSFPKEKEKSIPIDLPRPKNPVGRPPKWRKLEAAATEQQTSNDSDCQHDDDDSNERKRKRRCASEELNSITNNSVTSPTPDLEQLQQELRQSILLPGYNPNPENSTPFLWSKHSHYLNNFVDSTRSNNVISWNHDEVMRFVCTIPGCASAAKIFKDQQIDGEALLMMAQEDLVQIIGLKLGPAIKLYNCIVLLRQKALAR